MKRKSLGIAVLLAGVLAAGGASACPTHAAPLPAKAEGASKQVKVVLDTPFVKALSFSLKAGESLAKHKVPQAVTIQALQGRGVVTTGDVKDPLSPTDLVLVGPASEHDITAETDMLVLVQVIMPGGKHEHTDGKGAAHEHHAH
jgi:quercetin dioxygenase-like cupin family protein